MHSTNVIYPCPLGYDNMAAPTKDALSLLKDYNDDSESSGDDKEIDKTCTKRPATGQIPYSNSKRRIVDAKEKRLPLPSALKTMHSSHNNIEDDTSLHDGRIRSFPHERGNWSTFVYIPFELTSSLEGFIDVALARLKNMVDIKVVSDFHISLTKTLILRHHWIDLFVKTVEANMKSFPRFQISFGSVKVYCNEEKTRTFIGMEVSEGLDSLMEAIDIMDKCVSEFNLPGYYKDPSFHLSIAWALGDTKEEMMKILPQLEICLNQFIFANPLQWTFDVSQLFCKIGNKYFSFQLQR